MKIRSAEGNEGGGTNACREQIKRQIMATARDYRALSLRTAVMLFIWLMGGIFYWKAFLAGAKPLETALFCGAAVMIGISIIESRVDLPEFSLWQLLEYGITAAGRGPAGL